MVPTSTSADFAQLDGGTCRDHPNGGGHDWDVRDDVAIIFAAPGDHSEVVGGIVAASEFLPPLALSLSNPPISQPPSAPYDLSYSGRALFGLCAWMRAHRLGGSTYFIFNLFISLILMYISRHIACSSTTKYIIKVLTRKDGGMSSQPYAR